MVHGLLLPKQPALIAAALKWTPPHAAAAFNHGHMMFQGLDLV
jgi:hypothetical protein